MIIISSESFSIPISNRRKQSSIRCAQWKDDSIILQLEEEERTVGTDSLLPQQILFEGSALSKVESIDNGTISTANGKSEHIISSLLQNQDNNTNANNNNVVNPKAAEETEKKEEDESSFEQFNVVNDLVSVSERILDDLDTTSSTYTTRNKSYSSLARLSKAHHSIMSKTSNMRRQRFVTGKYPLYVSVKQNPTNKWLGLAESQIYLNGVPIEKSLASYDIFN